MGDGNGKEILYHVLFTFESEETKKNYIVYTDEKKDEMAGDGRGDGAAGIVLQDR